VKALVIRIGFPEDHVLKAITGDVKEFGPLIECLSSSFPLFSIFKRKEK